MDYIKALVIAVSLLFVPAILAQEPVKPSVIVLSTTDCYYCDALKFDATYDEKNPSKILPYFIRDEIERIWFKNAETEEGQQLIKAYQLEDKYPIIIVGKLVNGTHMDKATIYYGYEDSYQFITRVKQ